MSNVAVMEPRPSLSAGARPLAIVPTSMDEAYRLAKAICLAGMAPKGLDKPESCMVAILHGLEVGLTPMAALQRIAVVNGRPTIWGDGAIGLVRASGLCEYVRERLEGQGDSLRAVCEAKRKGEPEPIIRTFSIADAKRAGLWDKAGPWKQYPTRMLAMRARAFALRDGFADVLGGLYLKEEMDDAGPIAEAAALAPQPARRLPPRAAALPAPEPQSADDDELLLTARATAERGTDALREYFETLDAGERERIATIADELHAIATQADAELPADERVAEGV